MAEHPGLKYKSSSPGHILSKRSSSSFSHHHHPGLSEAHDQQILPMLVQEMRSLRAKIVNQVAETARDNYDQDKLDNFNILFRNIVFIFAIIGTVRRKLNNIISKLMFRKKLISLSVFFVSDLQPILCNHIYD